MLGVRIYVVCIRTCRLALLRSKSCREVLLLEARAAKGLKNSPRTLFNGITTLSLQPRTCHRRTAAYTACLSRRACVTG